MDEAAGLPRIIFEAVVSLCVGEGNKVLAIGNPIEKSGPFYEACTSETWQHITISCLDHPNVVQNKEVIPGAVSVQWVNDMVKDHCTPYHDSAVPPEALIGLSNEELRAFAPPEAIIWKGVIYIPGPVFEAKVLGRPPDEGADQLISLAWVEAAKQWDLPPSGEKTIGFDPARYGGDYATMFLRQGSKGFWVKRRRPMTKNPSDELAGWLKSEIAKIGPDTWAFIDEIGIGAGTLDASRRMGLNVRGVTNSKRARQPKRFANIRSECWWRLREKLQKGELCLPDDDLLAGDLVAAKYFYDELGRIVIEDKDSIRARIGRSPDSGDAAALTFASPSLDVDDTDAFEQTTATTQRSKWYLARKEISKSRWGPKTTMASRLRRRR